MKLFSKKDFLLIATVLFAAVVMFLVFKNDEKGIAYEISVDSKVVCRESLYQKKTTVLKCGAVIVCDGNSVYFDNSDCPDLLCVGMGRLSHEGEWAACLPNQTYLEVVSK